MFNIFKRFGVDGFILSLFLAIFLAWIYPTPGAVKGLFSISTFANVGISGVFFFYGLRLNWTKIRAGLSNVKTHIVVFLSTFLLFPLLILGIMQLCGTTPTRADIFALQARGTLAALDSASPEPSASHSTPSSVAPTETAGPANLNAKTIATGIWLGVFFLATLPSTVSSSVVMTNIARGNVVAAIFDASLSSLFGVFLTPLWMRIFVDAGTGGRGFGEVLLSLIIRVLLPIFIGIYLNRFWGKFADKNGALIRKFDQSTILLVVYTAFCRAFADEMFAGFSGGSLFGLGAGMVALFFLVYGIIDGVCKILRFNREDSIATLFCGSKKSLMHGAAISGVILSDPKMAAILILPTLLYHALQLIIVSVIAQRYARKIEKTNAPKEPA